MSRNNNVRGPTSALTEFLRDMGITNQTILRRRQAQNQDQTQSPGQPAAGPSSLQQVTNFNEEENVQERDEDNDDDDAEKEPEAPPAGPSNKARGKRPARGYESDELDEPEEEGTAAKKRKLSKAAQAKMKAKEKERVKKKKKTEDDDSDLSSDDNLYTALSKAATKSSKPKPGDLDVCAQCNKQFTVTKYTIAATPGPGFLCHACAKASGTDPFKNQTVKKRKAPVEKRTIVDFEEKKFPSLATLCIQIVTNHIEDVEALGDIGALNLDEIAKTLSRNRSLTSETAQLFYHAQQQRLALYDVTKISPDGLCTLAMLNPMLTYLRLDYCGLINDTVITSWCSVLPALTHLELLGPFLVHSAAWISFFEAHPNLNSFLITQSPRFDLECMRSLVQSCTGLQDLRLKEVGQLNDEFLLEIGTLGDQLHSLDLSDPAKSCSEKAFITLLSAVGKNLKLLNLSGHTDLTDAIGIDGLAESTRHLTSLSLANLPQLTDAGLASFFAQWQNMALTSIDLSRNPVLGSASLEALLVHSGEALTSLNLNGWRLVSPEALDDVPKRAKELKQLDVGWCRAVDDFWMKEVLAECKGLQEVRCYGCNQLTVNCPRKRGVLIRGVEWHSVL